ncbi:MAG: aspartate/glutamate racemase family protein [Bacteroidales bacterium]|nr:aspartate/glutamate racemase family protein [Bacteroidales bacterium]
MIALIGGIGPAAGLNLAGIITKMFKVHKDQDFIPWMLMNQPALIPDRTEFLLGKVKENPGDEIARQILLCERAGCTVAGIACNTAHTPLIFNRIKEVLVNENSTIRLINVIDEMINYTLSNIRMNNKIGILGTTGSYLNHLHTAPLGRAGYEIIDIGLEKQEKLIHEAIYNQEWGIKVISDPAGGEAIKRIQSAINFYYQNGAGAVVLACSEISLISGQIDYKGMIQIKPMNILAEALVEVYQHDNQHV